ncbi:MAG: V-type ATP synthase subunit E [Patescibacteria group bacterium]
MALEQLLKSLVLEAEEEIKKIQEEGKKKVAALKEDYRRREKIYQENILVEEKKEAAKKIEQAKFQAENEKKSRILAEKQKILAAIFSESATQLADRPENSQTKLLQQLIDRLPREKEGKIIATKASHAWLKKILAHGHFPLASENIPGQAGFIFSSPKLEIDNRYETLIDQSRDELETEVAQILFN